MMKLLSLYILLILTFCTYSQTEAQGTAKVNSNYADSLFHHGNRLLTYAQYDSAILFFDSARTVYTLQNNFHGRFAALLKKSECQQAKGEYDNVLTTLRMDSVMENTVRNDKPIFAVQKEVIVGTAYRNKGKFDSAFVHAHVALAVFKMVTDTVVDVQWDILSLFAGLYFNIGVYDSAMIFNKQALVLFPFPNNEQLLKISGSLNGIATIHESRGDYSKALDYFMQSYDFRRRALSEKHPDIASLFNNIASIHFRLGDNDRALEYYLKSLSIMKETLPNDHPSFGVRYNNIAMAYRGKKEYSKALDFGLQSKAIFAKKLGSNHPNVAGVVNNIGRTYFDMKDYSRALESYHDAMVIWKEKLGEKHSAVTQSYFNIGEAYGRIQEYGNATLWLEKSLTIRRETLGEGNVKTAQSYNALGRVYADWGKIDSALLYYQQAMASLVDGIINIRNSSLGHSLRSSSDLDLLLSITGKADVLFMRGRTLRNLNDVQTSLDTYEKAIELTDKIRRGFGTEGAKIQLSQMSFDVYERAISSALFLFQKTKNTSYISKAFSIAERSKAGMLLDAIFESNAKQFAGIPDSLLEQESAFRTELTYHETLLQKEKEKKDKANEVKIVQWENRIFDLKRDNEQLVERFEREYPKYYSLKHQSEVISLSDIQKQLPDTKSALLEYVVGDTTVTIFAITKKSCIVKSQRLTSLTPLVKQFRQSIQNIEAREYIFLANGLYRQLIAPVQSELKGVQKLYIVPDGILNHLPFEALLTHQWKNSVAVDFSALPYLIRFYDVSYHISARSFLEHVTATQQKTSAKKNKKPEHEFMGIAPVFADTPAHSGEIYTISTERIIRSRIVDGERFVELKESEREVKSIFKLFEEHQKSGKMYLHNSATESSFKSDNMQETRFIHIATHGMINEENPKLSGVIFAAPEKGAMDDGVLYSGETYNLRLNADLVTLSACETGLGTIVKGEGLLGLTRGFMYAGAKNLLVSLWQVADKSTTELMVQFYRNILNNQQYSTALRNAKLAMIKKGKYAHPVEWSPFILTGK